MTPKPPGSSARRSWRETPARGPTPKATGSKTPLRILLALLVPALLAAFAWLLWQPARSEPPTYFVALLTGENDLLSVPPVLFEQQTLAPLKDLGDAARGFRYVDASQAQRAGDIKAVEALLAEQTLQPPDRLIVYVSAHGVSDEGQAYVLAPDYDLRKPEVGRYAAADLIQAVARIDAQTKVIVFDCSKLAVLPRMGMLVNEFASLVEEAARDVDDPRLCVVTAGAELQTSPIGLLERRCVLGGAVVDSLLGAADDAAHGGNGDRNVSFAEFQGCVAALCAQSAVAAPTPQFVFCGPEPSRRALAERMVFRLPADSLLDKLVAQVAKLRPKKETEKADIKQEKAAPDAQNSAAQTPPAAPATPPTGPPDAQAAPVAKIAPTTAPAIVGAPATPAPPADATAATPTPPPSAAPAPATPSPGPGPSEPIAAGGEPVPAVPAAPATQPPGPPAPPVPVIIQAWRLRDRLQPLDLETDEVLPLDFAPQLWSELNATLVALHLGRLGQPPKDAAASRTSDDLIGEYQRGLQTLLEGGARTSGDRLVTDDLNEARQRYDQTGGRRELESVDRQYADALIDLRRRMVRASQYVQWHAFIQGSPADAEPAAETARTIQALLEELILLDRNLRQLEAEPLEAWSDAAGLLRQIGISRDRIGNLVDDLDRRLAGDVAAAVSSGGPATQRVIEDLLATSVASADQREAMLGAMGGRVPTAATSRDASPRRWADALDHLRLEVLLVQLADPAMGAAEPLRALATRADASEGSSPDQRQLIRTAGRALRDFYAQLPARLQQSRQPGASLADRQTAEKLVALVHPRDASSPGGEYDAALGFIAPRLKMPAEIVLSAPRPLTLREGEWLPLAWTLRLQNAGAVQVEAIIEDYDASVIEARFPADAGDGPPQRSRRFVAEGDTVAISLEVKATNSLAAAAQLRPLDVRLRVKVALDSGDQEFESSAQVRLPRPNRVELFAACVDPPRPQDVQTEQCIVLRPFPNRQTTFDFALANYADEAKTVTVELIAAPAPVGEGERMIEGGWPAGRLLDEDGHTPPELAQWMASGFPGAAVIASGEIALPPDESPRRLALKPPAAPKPAEPPAEGAPAAPPEEEKPPATIDVSYGMVCRIVNKDRPEEVWIKWLEVVPLRPSSYVDFQGSVVGREITILAVPSDGDGDGRPELPPGVAAQPVTLITRGDGTLFRPGSVVPDSFNAIKQQARLTIQPLDDIGRTPTVDVEVDGFPRAVAWRVDFENQSVEQIRNPGLLRIDRIGMAGRDATLPRLYRRTPIMDYPEINPKDWPVVIDVGDDPICAFDISRGVRPLAIRMRVDAALDAFNSVGGGNAVILSWQNNVQAPRRLDDDRSIRSEIVKFTEAGELALLSTVDDFTLSLTPPGVSNRAVQLTARLLVQGAPEQVDKLQIVFDGLPPELQTVHVPPKVLVGELQFPVELVVADLSGVAQVEAWITAKAPRGVDELDPKLAELPQIPSLGPYRPRSEAVSVPLRLTTPAKPGRYFVTFRVTDRSGQATTSLGQPFALSVELPPPPPVPGPVIGDLKGRVKLGSVWANDPLKVTVKDQPGKFATTDGEGKFVIKSLKAGPYKLLVSGNVKNRPVSGELDVTLAEPADYQWKVVIEATWELQEPQKE